MSNNGEGEGYTLKEVIEKNFTDLKSEMRSGFSEVKIDVKEIRKTADDAFDSAAAANKRIDRYDKQIGLIWGLIVAALVKMIFDYIATGG